ncbi:hypothetical protein QBC35DRAFT_451580 [Podospora australis]|uniref:CorA-like transporter domain-containing protein n=1 Tax=Podospora australis TaxID=1536484 RepID=A0AAN7AIR5_9PEZI|nr:hypothetical protein QBC35DRAFT_451580 [Podospora australis]
MSNTAQVLAPIPASMTQQISSRSWALSRSLEECAEFPTNLITKTPGMNAEALHRYKKRLEAAEAKLFVLSEDGVEVTIHDQDARVVERRNIHSEAKLKMHLGIYRYIWAPQSRTPLLILKSMLTKILTYQQIMPEFVDFLASFGLQSNPQEVRFSGFRRQITLKVPTATTLGALGRSDQQYQMTYNLKGVTMSHNLRKAELWSIRTAVLWHRYDVHTNRASWIVVKDGRDLLERYKEMVGPQGRPEDRAFVSDDECFGSSLSPHLLFCRWSTEDWGGYIRWMEEEVDNEALKAVYGPPEDGHTPGIHRASDIRRLQIWEERANEAVVVLEGNLDVISSLRQFYQDLAQNDRFPRLSCGGEIADFVSQLDAMISELKHGILRSNAVSKTTADRKELIIQYRANESEERMHRLNKNMEEETVVVRIITIVTLIYLPATFVSTFFSTDIIKYQDEGFPGGKYSETAMHR